MKKIIFSLLILFCAVLDLVAQNNLNLSKTLQWDPNPITHNPSMTIPTNIWSFEDAVYNDLYPSLPIFLENIALPSNSTMEVRLTNEVYEPIALETKDTKDKIQSSIEIVTTVEQDRNQYVGKIIFIPIRMAGKNRYEKLVSFDLQVQIRAKATASRRGPTNTTLSVLADGDIYKIAVPTAGMYKMDYNFLKDELGIDIDNVDPNQIHLYGNGSGRLPEANATMRIDDLEANAIEIVGIEDGKIDNGDYILFYGEGANKWTFDTDRNEYQYQKNIYTNQNYYFLKIGDNTPDRVSSQASMDNTAYTTTTFDGKLRYEDDRVNLLHGYALGQGSGKDWYGDLFEVVRERTYDEFNFPNIVNTEEAIVKAAFAGRSEANSLFKTLIAGQSFTSSPINKARTGEAESTYAYIGRVNQTFLPTGENLPITIEYPENAASSKGWIDYMEVQAKRELRMVNSTLIFSDKATLTYPSATFQLSNATANTQIWDITDPLNPVSQAVNITGNQLSFGIETTELKTFIAFNLSGEFGQPTVVGKIANQNLHGIDNVDMIIIHPAEFAAEAEQLAQHRRDHSQLTVELVPVNLLYNEFSSGKLDPTAIRDFAKMVYERNDQFKYLLLFGDGSFDARSIYSFETPSDFIPIYETDETLNPIGAYPSDDYYALLSDDEGENLTGSMDIAVGRFTVKNKAEAQTVVNKVIDYDNNPDLLGDWRNSLLFVADDEDSNGHLNDADGIANIIDTTYVNFNINKIYLDAFQQISTPGGEKYPSVTEGLNKAVFKGLLVMNYLGHGGSTGWTQERVLKNKDIESWTNRDKLPLLVTATCSFAGYDDPAFVTAGERALLNNKGGAVALYTTVRAVFANSNERLTRAVFVRLFEKINGEYPTIGEIMRIAKNAANAGENSRKFTLLGDPAMKLALPEYNVATTEINGHNVSDGLPDTLRALQKVTIKGQVEDNNGNLMTAFNGSVFPTIFDKKIALSTLGQDSGSFPKNFLLQKNILFKGEASVNNGVFEFSFIVPKDINYDFGAGKISYYAKDNELRDANGYYEGIVVGGTDPNATNDDQGPTVEVFMDNEEFVFGGVTDENPILFVKLSDDNGINVAGSSIGHDLTGILDENSENNYLLNDFYEAALDDYTRGEVKFPLFNIAEGRHQIKVKAWDVANNSAEGYTEFVVASSEEAALEQVLNYPNPFTTSTNFQFEHNLPSQLLNVQVRIFTVSGKLVKTIEQQILTDGYRVTDVAWNGSDDFGEQLARGVYLYKIKVGAADAASTAINTESDFEKLVILK